MFAMHWLNLGVCGEFSDPWTIEVQLFSFQNRLNFLYEFYFNNLHILTLPNVSQTLRVVTIPTEMAEYKKF